MSHTTEILERGDEARLRVVISGLQCASMPRTGFRRTAARGKRKVDKILVRSAMMYCFDNLAVATLLSQKKGR